MPLPTLQKTWTHTVYDLPQGLDKYESANAFWVVVAGAFGGMWVNGIHHDYSGSEHSWIVVEHPTGIQICFDTNYPEVQSTAIVVSPAAGFTGGTTRLRATAADEHPIALYTYLPEAPFATVVHVLQSTDGLNTRVFWFRGGLLLGVIGIEAVSNPVSGWTTPAVTYGGAHLNTEQLTMGPVSGASPSNSYLWTAQNGVLKTASPTGDQFGAYLLADRVSFLNTPNPLSGLWPLCPVTVTSGAAAIKGRLGYLPDLWWGGAPTGTCYPADGSRQFLQIGCWVVPWDGSIPVGMPAGSNIGGEAIGTVPATWGPPVIPETTKPTITIISPPVGTPLGADVPLVLEVTDASGLRRALFKASFAGRPWELPHDGDAFDLLYADGSTQTPVANGYRYSLKRLGGWPSTPSLTPFATDTAGNEAD